MRGATAQRRVVFVFVLVLAALAACGFSVAGSADSSSGSSGNAPDGGGQVIVLPDGGVIIIPADGSAEDDSGSSSIDGGESRCDLTKPFGPAIDAVPGLSAPNLQEGHAWLTEDELTAWVIIGNENDREIYTTTRASKTAAFPTPTINQQLSTTNEQEDNITLTSNQLVAYFATPKQTGHFEIWYSTRPNTTAAFGTTQRLTGISTTSVEGDPWITPNGEALYFDSDRNVFMSDEMYVSRRGAGGAGDFTMVTPLSELNMPGVNDRQPVLSADELNIVFYSNRSPTKGGGDLWTARRSNRTAQFSQITHQNAVSSGGEDFPTWISADGCVLYVSSDRNGTRDIFRTERPK